MIEAQREITGMGAAGLKNAYTVDGKRYGGSSTYTVYQLARALIEDGQAWDQDIRIVNPDGMVSLTGSLSDMAGCGLSENASGFSYLGWSDGRQKYRPFHRP